MIVYVYVKSEKEHRALSRVARTPDHLQTRSWKHWKDFPYRKIDHVTQLTGLQTLNPIACRFSVPEYLNMVGNQPSSEPNKRKPSDTQPNPNLKQPDERLACVIKTMKGMSHWPVGTFVYAKPESQANQGNPLALRIPMYSIRPEGHFSPTLAGVSEKCLSFAAEYDLKDAQEMIRCLENSRKG